MTYCGLSAGANVTSHALFVPSPLSAVPVFAAIEYSIAAKTGTAERGDGTNNAWLVTFAPADNPQYVIVANRLKTTEIGKTLAPVVEDLYNTLFDAN